LKAFLLAAGLGTRLRPLTESVPKCLVPIAGRPLLSYWLELLARHGVTDVLVNLHHLPEHVREFAAQPVHPVRFTLTFEPELLGSAGTVAANWGFVVGEESFIIGYADNLTNADLTALLGFHAAHDAPLTMGLFRAEDPCACGIADVDERGVVTSFEEKPECPRSDLANAGLYAARPSLRSFLPERVPADIGKDLLPGLVGLMRGVEVDGYVRDIGTWDSYRKAEEDVAAGRLVIA
jgi:mannose-1-phosphate guanylyltransferase